MSSHDSNAFCEADGVARAWVAHRGALPQRIDHLIETGRYLDAAIELAQEMIGEPPLAGWRLRFTSAGGPYAVELLNSAGAPLPGGAGASEVALSDAFLNAIDGWSAVRPRRQA